MASLSAINTDMAVLDALPRLLWPGMIFTLYLLIIVPIINHHSSDFITITARCIIGLDVYL